MKKMRKMKTKIVGVTTIILIILTVGQTFNFPGFISADNSSFTYNLRSFSSYEEFTGFLSNLSGNIFYTSKHMEVNEGSLADDSVYRAENDLDFSETNIQVAGVDEPDIVKTDGGFIYFVSASAESCVYIIKAWPAENSSVVSMISTNFSVRNVFINENRLVLLGEKYGYVFSDSESKDVENPWLNTFNTQVEVYDVKNHCKPELIRRIILDGYYYDARMINDYVYVITLQYPCFAFSFSEEKNVIPGIIVDDRLEEIDFSNIYYVDMPYQSCVLTHVASVNIKDDEKINNKIFVFETGQTLYVSKKNVYIACPLDGFNDFNVLRKTIEDSLYPLVPNSVKQDLENTLSLNIPDYKKTQILQWIIQGYLASLSFNETKFFNEMAKQLQRTIIYRISIDHGDVEYVCNGTVPGHVLNQFSMDEHKGFFRIVTMIDTIWFMDVMPSANLYVLNGKLEKIGGVENISPGEQVYSARFNDEKAFIVTFKRVDPFFIVDLSDPYNPTILGELKIPGYSLYLHPVDETHVIGVGREINETMIQNDDSSILPYSAIGGVKISLFNISNPCNPVEVDRVILGGEDTYTPVLYDHKAFLFNEEKKLLVIPVNMYVLNREHQTDDLFQGVYVYKLSLDRGFEYKGRITHNMRDFNDSYWYQPMVRRSLYIENVLYTLSDKMVKMNNVEDLKEIKTLRLS